MMNTFKRFNSNNFTQLWFLNNTVLYSLLAYYGVFDFLLQIKFDCYLIKQILIVWLFDDTWRTQCINFTYNILRVFVTARYVAS